MNINPRCPWFPRNFGAGGTTDKPVTEKLMGFLFLACPWFPHSFEAGGTTDKPVTEKLMGF